MYYSISDICKKFGTAHQGTIRTLLCLPQYEKKRMSLRNSMVYNLSPSELNSLKLLWEKRQKRRYIKGCALTERENEIYLLLVDKGLNYKQISEQLNLEISTIRKEADTICLKKGVRGSQRLMQLAVRYWRKRYVGKL